MTRTKSIYLASLAVLLSPMVASADPISFNISQSGFADGGTITGMFTGDDLNMDGAIDSAAGEVSAFTASWSGNGTVGATTWGFADLTRILYELGTGDIGDDGACCGTEGLLASNAAGFNWNTGDGPGGFGARPGGGIQGPTGAIITTRSLVLVTSVPEPGTLALLGIGLLGMGAARCRRKV